eukprot:TRINITY_DN6343_c0_g1_i2.p1 TRINITY_DN6343_c0_g1~~TRINITY_DN6343_c0_g1_i2.p1  ORF type:complete len:196 (+),score=70.69 TRINITY_DN6343_c0_g1_i2:103-690(+)
MIRRPPTSTLSSSSAASDVYKRQEQHGRCRQLEVQQAEADNSALRTRALEVQEEVRKWREEVRGKREAHDKIAEENEALEEELDALQAELSSVSGAQRAMDEQMSQATGEIARLEHALRAQCGSQTSQEEVLRALQAEVDAETLEADMAEHEVLSLQSANQAQKDRLEQGRAECRAMEQQLAAAQQQLRATTRRS